MTRRLLAALRIRAAAWAVAGAFLACPHSPALASGPASLPGFAHRLAAAPLLYGHFTQAKDIQGIKKPLVSQGDFLVARDKGVIWRTRKPFAAAVAVTAKGLWSLQATDSTRPPARTALHLGNLGATLGMMQRVLSGDPAGLEKDFAIETGGTASAWTLRLVPKDPAWARFVKSISLAGRDQVDSVAYLEANGDKTRIVFTDVGAGAGDLAAWADPAFRD